MQQEKEKLDLAMDPKDLQNHKYLIQAHPLTNLEIQKYYQNKPRFNGVYSRDNLAKKIKDGVHIINIDEYSDTGTHWIALYLLNNNVTYFDSFGVEHTPKEIEKFINGFTIKTNIYRIQANESLTFVFFFIGFIDFMLKGKSLTDFTSPFSLNNS